jgi:hypothetical protein
MWAYSGTLGRISLLSGSYESGRCRRFPVHLISRRALSRWPNCVPRVYGATERDAHLSPPPSFCAVTPIALPSVTRSLGTVISQATRHDISRPREKPNIDDDPILKAPHVVDTSALLLCLSKLSAAKHAM